MLSKLRRYHFDEVLKIKKWSKLLGELTLPKQHTLVVFQIKSRTLKCDRLGYFTTFFSDNYCMKECMIYRNHSDKPLIYQIFETQVT